MQKEPVPRSLHAKLYSDHQRIDAILRRCESRFLDESPWGSVREYAEFYGTLIAHFCFEEEYVFPLCEGDADTSRPGPIAILRAEHAQVRRLLEEILRLYEWETPDRARFTALRRLLVDILQEHVAKEDRLLYPMAERIERLRRRFPEASGHPSP